VLFALARQKFKEKICEKKKNKQEKRSSQGSRRDMTVCKPVVTYNQEEVRDREKRKKRKKKKVVCIHRKDEKQKDRKLQKPRVFQNGEDNQKSKIYAKVEKKKKSKGC